MLYYDIKLRSSKIRVTIINVKHRRECLHDDLIVSFSANFDDDGTY